MVQAQCRILYKVDKGHSLLRLCQRDIPESVSEVKLYEEQYSEMIARSIGRPSMWRSTSGARLDVRLCPASLAAGKT